MDLGLSGRRAIVTGGSKGIGRRCADILAEEGAHVAICARDGGDVTAAVEELKARGMAAYGEALDVADKAALEAWVANAAGELGGIDIVVANVSALAAQNTEEAWRAQFEVDLMHTVRLAKAAIPHLERSGQGSIVAVSSVSGRESDAVSGPYGTMKTAIVGYVSGLAMQLAGRGVRANVVSPGNTYFPDGFWQGIERGDPELFASALGLNPTGRMGTAEEMAKAVVFLSSPVSSFTTGTNLVVDGALTRGIQL